MTTDFVGAEHEFHDDEFARGWADRFTPTPERLRLFELINSQVSETIPADGNIVELGLGPGYLASYLLERMPEVSYCGIDYSSPMLEIAQGRLEAHAEHVTYIQADLVGDAWEDLVSRPVHAVVSTWALHDLGSPENVRIAYCRSYDALASGGILVNGDFIKPLGALQDFEGGRFPVTVHIKLLGELAFRGAECLSLFEKELENPGPAQNYACIQACK